MSYKTIIAYLARPETVHSVMNVALPLAEKHKAHLIGLHVVTGVPITGTVGVQIPVDVLEQYAEHLRDDAKLIKAAFHSSIKDSKLECEWLSIEQERFDSNPLSTISEQVRGADVVVVGQTIADQRAGELIADIILDAGRPAVLVPSNTTDFKPGAPIAVAWDGSREAARAAFDALPLLKNAKAVHVVSVQRREGDEASGLSGDTLATVLARHGVKSEAHLVTSSDSVGTVLMDFANEKSCGLLVMGCYGHSRFMETLFGGATRGVLQDMNLPILMSH